MGHYPSSGTLTGSRPVPGLTGIQSTIDDDHIANQTIQPIVITVQMISSQASTNRLMPQLSRAG
jgi:hypothetical protein